MFTVIIPFNIDARAFTVGDSVLASELGAYMADVLASGAVAETDGPVHAVPDAITNEIPPAARARF